MDRTTRPASSTWAPLDRLLEQLRRWPQGHYRPLSSEQWEAHCPACGGRQQLTIHELLPNGPVIVRCGTGCAPDRITDLLDALEQLHRAADTLRAHGMWDEAEGRPAVALQPEAPTVQPR